MVPDVAEAFRLLVDAAAPRTLALSGGQTARACYERLATASRTDWSRVEVLFGDERWLPVEHEGSNEGLARRALLDHVPVGAVHSVRGAGPTIAAAAAVYDRLVRSLDGIDMVHLGLGADGHTASLFPGSAALEVTDRFVVTASHVDFDRVTFTPPAIASAQLVVVTVAGGGKAEAVQRVVEGDVTAPAVRVDAEQVIWLVDPAAAGRPAAAR